MTADEWKTIDNFTPLENWGEPSKMEYALVKELDRFRKFMGIPMVVTCGFQGVHVIDSEHYYGRAVDIVFPTAQKDQLADLFLNACRFNFNGIGLYPHWKYEGRKVGGLHLDIRQADKKAFWLAYQPLWGKQTYIPLTWLNLKSYLS